MKKLLLVEDNDVNRELMLRRLQRRGYEIQTAVDGNDAVEKTRQFEPDLIIMDISLPVMDGIEASRIIKADENFTKIPIVGLSAHALQADRQAALNAGLDDYVTKPVDFENLINIIERLLKPAVEP
jgi:CheY-like chemotaxis protein